MVSKSSYDELNQKFEHKLVFLKFLVILFYRKEPLGLNSKGYCLLFIFQCTSHFFAASFLKLTIDIVA